MRRHRHARQDTRADAASKPQALHELNRPSWAHIVGRSGRQFVRDQCTDMAAALTYHATLSLFPALLAVVALLGVFGHARQTSDAVMRALRQVAPGQAVDLLKEPVHELVSSPAAGLALIVGILGALWSTSGYVRAFARGMNRIYGVDEARPFWKLLPVMLLATVAGVVLAGLMVAVLALSGPVARAVGDAVGLGGAALAVWSVLKWPVLVVLAVVGIALLYDVAPNVRQPRFRWISVGAVIALVVAAAASAGFAFYAGNFSHYNKTYGAIGGVIVLLLWIWIVNLALLFGAEFDAETERGRELQAGIPAQRSLRLPARDTRTDDAPVGREHDT